MNSGLCGQWTVQCVDSLQCSLCSVDSAVWVCGQCSVWVSGQCSAGRDCLSGAAFRSKSVSSAQARWVQQASSQRLGERVQGHLVTAMARAETTVLTMARSSQTAENRSLLYISRVLPSRPARCAALHLPHLCLGGLGKARHHRNIILAD